MAIITVLKQRQMFILGSGTCHWHHHIAVIDGHLCSAGHSSANRKLVKLTFSLAD